MTFLTRKCRKTRMSIQAAAISKSFGDFRALSDVTVTTPPAI